MAAFDSAGAAGPRSLTRIDLATGDLLTGEPERGATLVRDALTISDDRRTMLVASRAGEFLAAGARYRAIGPMQELVDVTARWQTTNGVDG